MSQQGEPKIAIVHDELTRRGGAENTLEQIIRVFPKANIFTLYAGKPTITVDGIKYLVGTTFLQNFPMWFRRHPARLLPLLPIAAEQIDLSGYDLAISSSSAFAKAIVTRANIPHLCYCHSPTRYLWDDTFNVANSAPLGTKGLSKLILHYLRLVDYAAAQRVDKFIANSNWTKQRIAKTYHRNSTVIYPPVDTSFFTPGKREAKLNSSRPFLCVGRLTPSKLFDQAITVCEKLSLPLIIVGRGQAYSRLKKIAGKNTRFVGKVDSEYLRVLYRTSRALLQPGTEDFGIASIEAQSCGLPVIAYSTGGAAETIRHNETGVLYSRQGVEDLAEGIRKFIQIEELLQHEDLQKQAMRFTTGRFNKDFYAAAMTAIKSFKQSESPKTITRSINKTRSRTTVVI